MQKTWALILALLPDFGFGVCLSRVSIAASVNGVPILVGGISWCYCHINNRGKREIHSYVSYHVLGSCSVAAG